MITQENENNKRAAKIIYFRKLKGITQKQIADELGIKKQVVNGFIHGRTKSKRISTWILNNLGVAVNE